MLKKQGGSDLLHLQDLQSEKANTEEADLFVQMRWIKPKENLWQVISHHDENNFLILKLKPRKQSNLFSCFLICGLNLSACQAGWTSEEEGWWLASILMFNPISVSTLDKPLLPVIHHLHNNGTPWTLIKNINLQCPLSRNVQCAHCSSGDAIPIHINACLLSRQ